MNDTGSRPHEGLPCPVCRVDLVMSDRQGIEIDYCPKCRGVWLDRGELDKIIERNVREPSSVQEQAQPGFLPQPGAPTPWGAAPAQPGYQGYAPQGGHQSGYGSHGGGHGSGHGSGHGGGHGGGYGKRGFLGRIFD